MLGSIIPSFTLAQKIARFDKQIALFGLERASKKLYLRLYGQLRRQNHRKNTAGLGQLFVANHPGLGDSLALLQSIDTGNLKIVVNDQAFFRLMPNLQPYLLFVSSSVQNRIILIQDMLEHLRQGGDLLIYPAGRIEHDPACPYIHEESPIPWSSIPSLLAKRALQQNWNFTIQLVKVSDVFHKKHFDNWFVRKAVSKREMETRNSYFSILYPDLKNSAIKLSFPHSMLSSELVRSNEQNLRDYIYQSVSNGGEARIPVGQ